MSIEQTSEWLSWLQSPGIRFDHFINIVLLTFLAVSALAIARIRSLFGVAMLTGIFSLLSASIFVVLDAVDVALTEAAVGAGLITVLFLGTLALTGARETQTPKTRALLALLVVSITGAVLMVATLDMPRYSQPDTPVQEHPLTEHYLQASKEEIGIPNVVTSVLASYRGYDTLGEVVVIFTAGVGVLLLLGIPRRPRRDIFDPDEKG